MIIQLRGMLLCAKLFYFNNFLETFVIMVTITSSMMKKEVKEAKNVQLISNEACDPPKIKAIPEIMYK